MVVYRTLLRPKRGIFRMVALCAELKIILGREGTSTLIVTWPGEIIADSRSDVLINDILATIADVVGFDLLESQAKDSHSFYPLLKGDANFQARDEVMLGLARNVRQRFAKEIGSWSCSLTGN